MWCTQGDLTVPDTMGQKAACLTQKTTTVVTFTDDVGGHDMDKVKTRRSPCIPPTPVMQCFGGIEKDISAKNGSLDLCF